MDRLDDIKRGGEGFPLALDIGSGSNWGYTHPSQIMDEIAMTTPSFAGVTYEKIETMGSVQWPCNEKAPEGTPRISYAEAFTVLR